MNSALLLTIFYLASVHAVVPHSPIAEIFKSKGVKDVLFHYTATKHRVSMQKDFQKHGIKSKCFNIKNSPIQDSSEIPLGYSRVGLYLNTTSEIWERVLASHRSNLIHPFSWIIFTNNFSNTVNTLMKYPIELNSDVTILTLSGEKYLLHEIYNTGFHSKGTFVVRNIGEMYNKFVMFKNVSRHDFRGLVLKCGVVLMENVTDRMSKHYLTVSCLNKVDPLNRFKYFKLLSHLKELFNFSCKIIRTNSWGYQYNNSFDGLVGLLQRRQVDIGAAPVFYRIERAKVVEYTSQTWPAKPAIILRQPKYSGRFYSLYTRPLTKTVWLCIFLVLIVAGAILGLMLKIRILKAEGDEEETSPSLAILFIFGAISQQGMPVCKKSTSVKMVVFATFIFTLTLYQYYNATVVSTLLRVPAKVIDSLKTLVDSDFSAGADDTLYNRDFFKHTTDPLAIELYHKKIVHRSSNNYFTPDDGVAKVKKGSFAFLVDTATAYRIMRKTFTEREVCDATEVSLYPPQSMGTVALKGTPYKEFVALGTSRMLECGVMSRLKSMWDASRPPCVRTPDASVFSVNIYEFSMALAILLLGNLASILVLLCEILSRRFKRYNKIHCCNRKVRRLIDFRH